MKIRTRHTTRTAFSFVVPTLAREHDAEVQAYADWLESLDPHERAYVMADPTRALIEDFEQVFGVEFTLRVR